MGMVGRKFTSASVYRYGFNGKENDNEVKGEGNQQDYGMRIFDSRVSRFLSVDPVTNKYPELTPYQFASNRPIDGIDMDGLEWWKYAIFPLIPIIGFPADQEVSDGFTEQAAEYIHGLKNLPRVVIDYLQSHTSSLPGGAYVKQQEDKRKAIEAAFAEGGTEYTKQMWTLSKAAIKGDKKAIGALAFEAMIMLVPEAKGFSAAGKYGKLLSAQTKGLILDIGLVQGSVKEIGIITKSGSRQSALKIAEELTGAVPPDATVVLGKQGMLTDQLVGYTWKGDDGATRTIRLDHDPKKGGGHINVAVGKDKFAIDLGASDNQVKQMAINEIMKELIKP